jgi:hypothetical protein
MEHCMIDINKIRKKSQASFRATGKISARLPRRTYRDGLDNVIQSVRQARDGNDLYWNRTVLANDLKLGADAIQRNMKNGKPRAKDEPYVRALQEEVIPKLAEFRLDVRFEPIDK